MSFVRRFWGSFFDPGKTFRALAAHPIWVDALAVVLAAYAAFTFVVFPLAQKDNLRQLQDNAARVTEKYGAERYEAAVARMRDQSRPLASLAMGPMTFLIGLLFSALIALGLGKTVSTQGHYLQVFSSLLHANFIDKILGNGVRLALVLARGSTLGVTTGLPVFFPRLPATSTTFAVLNQVDFFQLWMFGAFGLGLASAFKVSVRKGLAISYIVWLLRSALMVGAFLLQKKFLQ